MLRARRGPFAAVLLLFASCSAQPGAPPPSSSSAAAPSHSGAPLSSVPPPSAPSDAPRVEAPDAGAPSSEDGDAGMSAWQKQCAEWLRAAIRTASAVEPGLRGAWVEHERRPDKEAVWIAAFPPVFPMGGLHVRVERAPGKNAGGASPEWQRHAESFHGGYHATFLRKAGELDASISFDGWAPEKVRLIAPYFQSAAEHCDPGAGGAGQAAP